MYIAQIDTSLGRQVHGAKTDKHGAGRLSRYWASCRYRPTLMLSHHKGLDNQGRAGGRLFSYGMYHQQHTDYYTDRVTACLANST